MIPKEFKNQEFKEAFEIATQTAWNKDELEVYEYIALKEADEINALRTAEKKGIQKGKEEGLKEGEKKAKIEIVKNSLKEGLDIDIISKLTGLTIEEIKKIKDENETKN